MWDGPGVTTYTHGHAESVLASHRRRTAEGSAAFLLPHLRPGQDLLDVGCGPGSITVGLAARTAPGRALGVDAVAAPLAEARAAADAAGVALDLRVADVMALPLPDDSVDVVHAHQVLQHLQDPVGALREMARVCRPGGLVAVRDADYAAMTWWPRVPALDRWLQVYRATAHGHGAEPDAGRRLVGWAQRAGLVDLVPSAGAWCFATPEDRAWWGGTWAERALRSDVAVHAVRQGHVDEAGLREIADGFRAWAEAPDAWWAVLHGELLARPAP